jgi:hypothetical protein
MDDAGSVQNKQRYSKLTVFRLMMWGTLMVGNCLTCLFALLSALAYGFGSVQVFVFLIGALWISYSASRIQNIRRLSVTN